MTTTNEKIRASGRVVRVAPSYVYMYSEQYGSVFSYPASYLNYLPEKPSSTNLTEFLRIDDVVHFVAVPQKGPNDCRWIAIKITKSQKQPQEESMPDAAGSKVLPDVIRNVTGTITELYEQNGFLYSEKHGKIYFPMAAAAPMSDSNELYPLNELFDFGEVVLFDAQRQPCKNDCLYMATRVQSLPFSYVEDSPADSSRSQAAAQIGATTAKKNGDASIPTNGDTPEDVDANLVYEEGEISRLFPQYGFIRSDKLGSVFFTLSHFESASATYLMDELTVGDRVRFVPMPQQEKNGCRWRGLKVQRLESDLISSLSQLIDGSCSVSDDQPILCEVSVQTDQSLWNAFLALQAAAANKRRPQKSSTATLDASCQTKLPPEALLLKAVKEDAEFKALLKDRFPHLMQFIDKTT